MGQDKALMSITPDGPSIVETVAQKVSVVANEILLVGTNASHYSFLDLPLVPDAFPGTGPLGGIHSALAASGSPYVLVVACDMPFLSVSLLKYLVSIPRDYDLLVPVLDRPQPLHAIYSRACLPLLEQDLLAGKYRVTGWFENANVRTVGRTSIERFDPQFHSFFNMNTPEEYERARQLATNSVATEAAPGVEPGRRR